MALPPTAPGQGNLITRKMTTTLRTDRTVVDKLKLSFVDLSFRQAIMTVILTITILKQMKILNFVLQLKWKNTLVFLSLTQNTVFLKCANISATIYDRCSFYHILQILFLFLQLLKKKLMAQRTKLAQLREEKPDLYDYFL